MANRSKNQCEVCGRFLRDDDPYGDFHTSHHHPVEYAEQMQRFHDQQAVSALTRRIRQEQRSGSGPITAVMVSRGTNP